MDAVQTLAQILKCGNKLSPDLFEARNDQLIRGGLPGSSMRDGSPSATTPHIGLDKTDENALARRDEYRQNLTKALALLARNAVLESPLLPERYLSVVELTSLHKRMAREAVEEVSSRAGECVNCHRAVERTPADRLISGRCWNCYRYRLDHDGIERPRELWEREMTA